MIRFSTKISSAIEAVDRWSSVRMHITMTMHKLLHGQLCPALLGPLLFGIPFRNGLIILDTFDRTPPHDPVPDSITGTQPVVCIWGDYLRQVGALKSRSNL
ncbi:hypothetical protein AVEN_141389-1 [Araneus ventricosus]|uniref:Uncharacterized protein n=1 Tax=Araneus ventricosus TaxID=182803 RepID=A0A4Y2D1N5_ARAVE|nr:hypothetical protein AVEN_141389-1 [Araneus ventricosus]